MKNTIVKEIRFGRQGDAVPHQLFGWSLPEDNFTWTDGDAAGILIDGFTNLQCLALEVFVQPHISKGPQRVVVCVNNHEIGAVTVHTRCRLAWILEHWVYANSKSLTISFSLPDAVVPAGHDKRKLGLSFFGARLFQMERPLPNPQRSMALPLFEDPQRTSAVIEGLVNRSVGELALGFESLGRNCELGFVQRSCGVEPLSLLRFSGTYLDQIVHSLDVGFSGLGDPVSIDPVPDEIDLHDWIVYERLHLLRYHTWVKVDAATKEQIVSRETKRLAFLKAKFMADLKDADKTFVYHSHADLCLSEILPLFLALRRHSEATLLYFVLPSAGRLPCEVREVMPGLFEGVISAFSDGVENRLPQVDEWLCICAAVHLLRHEKLRDPGKQ